MKDEKKITNPVKAIRAKCLDCCCGSSNEVKLCHLEKCPLHPFRFGKNPYRTPRQLTEVQRAAMAARMRDMRSRQKSLSNNQGKND